MTGLRNIAGSVALVTLAGCTQIGSFENAVRQENTYLSWIDRIGSNELFEFNDRTYEVWYLPVGVPYSQARDRNGVLDPASVLDAAILDAGVRMLEVARYRPSQFLPQDEAEAKRVAVEFCKFKGGWPENPQELVEILGEEQYVATATYNVSFSHGRFRFPGVCDVAGS